MSTILGSVKKKEKGEGRYVFLFFSLSLSYYTERVTERERERGGRKERQITQRFFIKRRGEGEERRREEKKRGVTFVIVLSLSFIFHTERVCHRESKRTTHTQIEIPQRFLSTKKRRRREEKEPLRLPLL
jgi:hypothetical protein